MILKGRDCGLTGRFGSRAARCRPIGVDRLLYLAWPVRESNDGLGRSLGADVTIWRIDLEAFPRGVGARAERLLDEDERSRWRRLKTAKVAARFFAAHVALRVILGGRLGEPPQSLRFARSPNGKPHLADNDIAFNLSHSEDVALVAVGGVSPLGVDVEKFRDVPDLDAMIVFSCTEGERAALARIDDRTEKTKKFLDLWVRKEAAAKSIGVGLRIQLRDIDVSGGVWRPALDDGAPGGAVHVQPAPADGLLSAIAFCGPPRPFHMRAFQWDELEAIDI